MPAGFKTLWPDKEHVVPVPGNAGDMGGTKGGYDAGTDSRKETQDAFGPKVTTVELSGGAASKGDKITDKTFSSEISTTGVRKPKKSM